MPHVHPLARCVLVALSSLLVGCSAADKPGALRLNTDYLPPGSLRLCEVRDLAPREELLSIPGLHEPLNDAGITDDQIRDRCVAAVRIYCCGGPNQDSTMRLIYIPPSLNVQIGDIIEYRVGSPEPGGKLNTATRILQQAGTSGGQIRWDPPDDRLWQRVLYADWMPGEGWVHQGGLNAAWYKPATP
jgi:hypothetical protein